MAPTPESPVQSERKFSAHFGAAPPNKLNSRRPAGVPPISMSKKTLDVVATPRTRIDGTLERPGADKRRAAADESIIDMRSDCMGAVRYIDLPRRKSEQETRLQNDVHCVCMWPPQCSSAASR